MNEPRPLDPNKTIVVIKNAKGEEVGRIPATAPNVTDYIHGLVHAHGNCTADYVEDADEAMISRMLRGSR